MKTLLLILALCTIANAGEPTSIVLVTLKTCRPCQQCKSQTLPALAKRGWIVHDYSTGCNANIWVLDAEDDQAKRFGVGLVPTWCVCRGNRVVRRYVGFLSADEVAKAWRAAE